MIDVNKVAVAPKKYPDGMVDADKDAFDKAWNDDQGRAKIFEYKPHFHEWSTVLPGMICAGCRFQKWHPVGSWVGVGACGEQSLSLPQASRARRATRRSATTSRPRRQRRRLPAVRAWATTTPRTSTLPACAAPSPCDPSTMAWARRSTSFSPLRLAACAFGMHTAHHTYQSV